MGPPLPSTSTVYAPAPSLICLSGHGSCSIKGPPEKYWTGSVCKGCETINGRRNSTPLEVEVDELAGIMRVSAFKSFDPPSFIMRQDAAKALGAERLPGAELRPVHRTSRGKPLVEVIPPAGLHNVAVKGLELFGRHCAGCARQYFSHKIGECSYEKVYSQIDIESIKIAGWVNRYRPELCVRRDWWISVRDRPEFHGITGLGISMTAPSNIDPHPVLETR